MLAGDVFPLGGPSNGMRLGAIGTLLTASRDKPWDTAGRESIELGRIWTLQL